MLLWVWPGEKAATETPRGRAQVSANRPGALDAALPGDVTRVQGKNLGGQAVAVLPGPRGCRLRVHMGHEGAT